MKSLKNILILETKVSNKKAVLSRIMCKLNEAKIVMENGIPSLSSEEISLYGKDKYDKCKAEVELLEEEIALLKELHDGFSDQERNS